MSDPCDLLTANGKQTRTGATASPTFTATPSSKDEPIDIGSDQIGLALRQPSFSSLCGSMITKNGQSIAEQLSNDSPTVVFENNADHDIKQNSFSSLYNFVTKENPNKKVNLPLANSSQAAISPGTEISGDSEKKIIDEEDEDDQNIIVLKRLQNNNMERWKQIGYVPRQNIVPMCKTISHLYRNNLNNINSTDPSKFSQSFAIIQTSQNVADAQQNIEDSNNKTKIPNPKENNIKINNQRNTIKRARCNSSERINPLKTQVSIVSKISNPEPNKVPKKILNDLLDYQPLNDNRYSIVLFGKLDQLVTDPEIRHFLSKVPPTATPEMLRKLTQLVVQCSSRLWMEEVHYLNSIISNFRDSDEALQSQLNDIELNYNSEINAIELQIERKTNKILNEYFEETRSLDEDFKSEDAMISLIHPSEEVLTMKQKLNELTKGTPQYEELSKKIADLEAKEIKQATDALNRAYVEADRRIKERYVLKRAIARKKADMKLEMAELKRNRAIERLKQAQVIRKQIQKAVELNVNEVAIEPRSSSFRLMDRSGDKGLLNKLLQMMLDGVSIDDSDYDSPRLSNQS